MDHRRKLDRIEELSKLDLMASQGPMFELYIVSCSGLKEGSGGDRLPDAYVAAQFIELIDDGYKLREGLAPSRTAACVMRVVS